MTRGPVKKRLNRSKLLHITQVLYSFSLKGNTGVNLEKRMLIVYIAGKIFNNRLTATLLNTDKQDKLATQ